MDKQIQSTPEIQENITPKNSKNKLLLIVLLFVVFTLVLAIVAASTFFVTKELYCEEKGKLSINIPFSPFGENLGTGSFGISKFATVSEFKDYLSEGSSNEGLFGGSSMMLGRVETSALSNVTAFGAPLAFDSNESPARISSTNVQVDGIDEPDIVKAGDGNLFLSFYRNNFYPLPIDEPILFDTFEQRIAPDFILPPVQQDNTVILDAFPPEELEKIGGIDQIGSLLYLKDTLIIFADRSVFGYDVSTPSTPKEKWNVPYGENTSYFNARLYGDEVYLVTNTNINRTTPCPFVPIVVNKQDYSVVCDNIYHPVRPVPVNTTYTVFKLDTNSGEVKDSISIVGSYDAILYMSTDNIYLTYSYSEDFIKIFSKFLSAEGKGLFSEDVESKVNKLATYDISQQSKTTELMYILSGYLESLDKDEALKMENDLEDKMNTFVKTYGRDFQSTGIVKIDRGSLKVSENGNVPGHPLNQFSLDEYDNNLRIATNSGNDFMFSSSGDVNDVYILDKKLNIVGSVKDLGKDERIYSARFIEDKGYIVTFRQTDPFYVLDLSKPNNPALAGELKIPGYSSYLHPLATNLILGVGKEGSNVKLSLFDVSNPSDPIEIDKYLMDEYWSEALNTHHAFLQDPKYSIFFMPGSKGGYIFSYEDKKLKLVKAVSANDVKRAIYMDDYLYIVSDQKIQVLNEKNWELVKDFTY